MALRGFSHDMGSAPRRSWVEMTAILLIDDDDDVRASASAVLGREGFEVVTTADAAEGLRVLGERPFDLLITDIVMPNMDGVHAILEVRKTLPHIKIVAISGGGNLGNDQYQPQAITTTAFLLAATEAGADWVLTKPFSRDELTDCIKQLLHSN